MAQSLEQDSWSLESSQGWVMQVGQEPSPGQRDTKATLVSALDFVSCLVGQGHQRGETQGTHISPSHLCQIHPCSSSQQLLGWFFPNAPSGRHEPSCSVWHCNSCASPGCLCSCTVLAVNLIINFSKPH